MAFLRAIGRPANDESVCVHVDPMGVPFGTLSTDGMAFQTETVAAVRLTSGQCHREGRVKKSVKATVGTAPAGVPARFIHRARATRANVDLGKNAEALGPKGASAARRGGARQAAVRSAVPLARRISPDHDRRNPRRDSSRSLTARSTGGSKVGEGFGTTRKLSLPAFRASNEAGGRQRAMRD